MRRSTEERDDEVVSSLDPPGPGHARRRWVRDAGPRDEGARARLAPSAAVTPAGGAPCRSRPIPARPAPTRPLERRSPPPAAPPRPVRPPVRPRRDAHGLRWLRPPAARPRPPRDAASGAGGGSGHGGAIGQPSGGATPKPGALPAPVAPPRAPAAVGGPKSTIVVGNVGTYSGPAGSSVADLPQGVQVWSRWVNDRGGVNGHPIKFVVADDGGDPARHRALVQQMVETQGAIALVGNGEVITGASSVEYLTAKGIPGHRQRGRERLVLLQPHLLHPRFDRADVLEGGRLVAGGGGQGQRQDEVGVDHLHRGHHLWRRRPHLDGRG